MKHLKNYLNLMAFGIIATLAPWAHATDLFSNFNGDGVANGVVSPTTFDLQGPAQITQLVTYHWNNGQGKAPGSIYILAVNAPVSLPLPAQPHPAMGQPGMNNVPNAVWVANLNLILPAGRYEVYDSDPATLAQNAQSGHQGFVRVEGAWLPSVDLADNFNAAAVINGGKVFRFQLTNPATISQLVTYHWNNGAGRAPGSITLRSINAPFAFMRSYNAQGQPGMNNVQNAIWVANLNVTLPAATYEVDDSDPGSWSQNGQSNGVGFSQVHGTYLSPGLIVQPPPAPPKAQAGPQQPPPPPPSPYCGNPGYRLAMTPCIGDWHTTGVELVVTKALPSPLAGVEFVYYDSGAGIPGGSFAHVFIVPSLTGGNGAAVGSTYTMAAPELHALCMAGQYSRWELFPFHANLSGEGAIGLFRIEGCP